MRWGWLVVTLVVSGCGAFRATPPPPPPVTDGVQVGVASWYGPGFHGRRTANGEVYDQYDMTAAHPSLPLGTRAIVTNVQNGRAVEVRVNDRGPFVGNRVIDLSYGAARVIGLIGPGTGRVRIDVLGSAPRQVAARADAAAALLPPPPPVPSRPTPVPALAEPPRPEPVLASPQTSYAVEIATFGDSAKAEHLRDVIAHRFPDAQVVPLAARAGRYYRVLIGPYPLRGVAVARAELIGRLGYPAVILEEPAE